MLPQVNRTNRKDGTDVWIPFLAAAEQLEEIWPEIDRRSIEQSLFQGVPALTDDFIYVPESILCHLLITAVNHRMIPRGAVESLINSGMVDALEILGGFHG